MFKVIECISVQHDRPIVVLAAIISLIGVFAFFLLLARAGECADNRRDSWLATAAFAGGLSVWATHFVAMLAYQGTVAIEFDLIITTLSAVIAIAGFWVMLRLFDFSSLKTNLLAGLCGALVIAAMHFTGMSAINAAATVQFDPIPIIVGAVVSTLLLAGAFEVMRLSAFCISPPCRPPR
jgi:NO-binding membrane sensor protein with MHYT domain